MLQQLLEFIQTHGWGFIQTYGWPMVAGAAVGYALGCRRRN